MQNVKDNALSERVSLKTLGSYGVFVRSLRIQAGVTQEELAQKIGKSRRWLQDVERGRVALSFPAAIALLNSLGFDLIAERSKRSDVLDQVFEDLV